ncbi:MAG TPA: double-strand break repair protein AddB [Candidatus Cybelea sp.]|nr:double-strand break repair protein AddB [Candidatus Cybelea sp.]
MSRARPNVYTIATGTPFADAFASGLLRRHGDDPMAFSRVTVLLPTRRAVRALREALLRQSDGRPLLLPSLRPLGDVDEDELTLVAADQLDLPPAISELRRRLLLARLVLRSGIGDAGQATRLAAELGRLIDQVQTEQVGFDRLAGLAPAEFASHWQITLEFLKIVTENWPKVLAEEAAIDPADRRNRLMAALARRWSETEPAHPVYVAGSTGSVPASADLMRVVAYLQQGAVVLPGFDTDLDAESWAALDSDPTHPQAGMKQLLARLGVDRSEVALWLEPGIAHAAAARVDFLRQALRPAATTETWSGAERVDASAIAGMTRIDAAGPREEATVIALLMREALETPLRTAALVTADRDLARRVAAELRRWQVEVDDSAGIPLGETPPGTFLRLTAVMLASELAPVALLAALKHPLAAGGQARDAFRRLVRRLDRKFLRGPRPPPGFSGLLDVLGGAKRGDELVAWLRQIEAQAKTACERFAAKSIAIADMLAAHVAFAEWLTNETGQTALWSGEAGEAAANFVTEVNDAALGAEPIAGASWPGLLDALLEGRSVRPRFGAHPRLAIWGPLEARLQQADVLILGGLNEGSWPPDAGADPWLSRPMRQQFGLPSLERRIGLAAHDFQQAAAAANVVFTRAEKIEGTPTVPSRWLLRFKALLDANGLTLMTLRGDALRAWQRRLDRPDRVARGKPPEPRPPVSARPRKLSVTQIETWIRDPYAIYARHVLKLEPLDPLDADPGAAERGTFVHEAMEGFVRAFPDALPADAEAKLHDIARAAFGDALKRPSVRAFWWPRFLDAAAWFIELERERRRRGVRPLLIEDRGQIDFAASGGRFVLTAKADRIDLLPHGKLAILDYKTGAPPSEAQVASGLTPQLPLEAAIAIAGGFRGIPAAPIGELAYVRLRGGAAPGEYRVLEKTDPNELAARAIAGLKRLVEAFDRVETPFRSRPRPQFIGRFGDYDHLARVKEWSSGGSGEQ